MLLSNMMEMHNRVQWSMKDSVVSPPLEKIEMAFKMKGRV